MSLSKNVHHFSEKSSDTWLTPPDLIQSMGPFDLDPCCAQGMPWRTAKRMIALPQDGLKIEWKGLVFCNPPYSNVKPWVNKMVEHGNGVLLVSGKSPDSYWGNLMLKEADLILFLKKRIKFYHLNGTESKGRILPNALAGFGEGGERIKRLKDTKYEGVFMKEISK